MRIIVDIPGGFGNQLSGYAFGYALSKELGMNASSVFIPLFRIVA